MPAGHGEIAARSGVGLTTARNAIRGAARDGLLTVEERRRHMAPNLPSVVRVISREWRTWLEGAPTRRAGSESWSPRIEAFRNEAKRLRQSLRAEDAANRPRQGAV
jgi:DNA-binding GntR family transcriptional regulator